MLSCFGKIYILLSAKSQNALRGSKVQTAVLGLTWVSFLMFNIISDSIVIIWKTSTTIHCINGNHVADKSGCFLKFLCYPIYFLAVVLQWFQSPEGADGVMPFVTWWWSFHGSLPVWLSCSAPSFLPASVTSARQGCCPEQTGSASPVRRRTNTQSESEGKTLRCFERSFWSRWRIYLQLLGGEGRACPLGWLWLAVLVRGQSSLQSQSRAFQNRRMMTGFTLVPSFTCRTASV